VILIKAGGGSGLNWEGLARDVAELRRERPVVLVHGANALRDDLAARLGVQVRTVVSPSGIESVYTDADLLDVFLMAYAGLANKRVVARFQRHGVNAVGLCGVDGRLWEAEAKKLLYVRDNGKTKLLQNNLTGRVRKVNAGLIRLLLDHDYLPVLCAPAISDEHEIVNTDNDGAAAVLAAALGASTLIFLFEAPGFLREVGREESLVPSIPRAEIDAFLPMARGRMQKKLLGAKAALEAGIPEIIFADGRTEAPVRDALAGKGTTIR
jgi:acetylglutamate/LysW-gamma-L-alpha-aminoadipate kinase